VDCLIHGFVLRLDGNAQRSSQNARRGISRRTGL
jgi:hypothetical protein